jgi:3-dehydroquinate synthase
MVKHIQVHASRPYSVYIGKGVLETPAFHTLCAQIDKRLVIVTHHHLVDSLGKATQQQLEKHGLFADVLSFPAGEIYKTRETKQQMEDQLLLKQYGRDTCLIALGGGVVLDLVGFVGATYARGVPVIYLPTTLLAMVDASMGGKTGVNTPQGKNLIGTFSAPNAVFIDLNTLASLPEKEWRNGVVEMIKHALIADPHEFEQLKKCSAEIKQGNFDGLTDRIYASCLIKKSKVEQDEQDQGIRQLLNFGHTVGHAIEALDAFSVSHGEAVAIGMLVESYLSVQAGLLSGKEWVAIERLLRDYGLPLQTAVFQERDAFLHQLMLDKKTVKQMPHFVLLEGIGKPHCEGDKYSMCVSEAQLNQALDWAANYFSHG